MDGRFHESARKFQVVHRALRHFNSSFSLSFSLAFSRGSREKRISFRLHSTSAVNERGQDIGLPRTTSTFPPLRNTFHHPCKMARDSRQRVTLVHANRPLPRTPTHFLEPSRASRMREECVRNVREDRRWKELRTSSARSTRVGRVGRIVSFLDHLITIIRS